MVLVALTSYLMSIRGIITTICGNYYLFYMHNLPRYNQCTEVRYSTAGEIVYLSSFMYVFNHFYLNVAWIDLT